MPETIGKFLKDLKNLVGTIQQDGGNLEQTGNGLGKNRT
jgi:hypothetical protein